MDGSEYTSDPLSAGWREQPPNSANLIRMARRQIALVVLSILVSLSVGFAYIVTAEQFFTARVSLSLNSPAGAEPRTEGATAIELDTHVELIRSDETASAVIDELGLDENSDFVPQTSRLRMFVADFRAWLGLETVDSELTPENQLSGLISRVKKGLWVSRVGNTLIIDVHYTAYSRELAASLASAFARAHLAGISSRTGRSGERRIERLENRAEEVRQLAASADASVQEILQSSGRFAADSRELQNQISELRQQLARLEAEGAGLSMKLSLINEYKESSDVSTLVLGTPESIRLLNDLRLTEQRLEEVRQNRNASEETVALIESGLESLRTSLGHEVNLEATAVRVQLDINSAERESLTKQIAELGSYLQSKIWSQLEAHRRDKAFYEDMYQDYLKRIEDAYRDPQTRSDLRIVSDALPPMTPVSPNQKVVLAICLTIGAFLGIGIAMLREWYRHVRPRS